MAESQSESSESELSIGTASDSSSVWWLDERSVRRRAKRRMVPRASILVGGLKMLRLGLLEWEGD